jgi:hypothetical protein
MQQPGTQIPTAEELRAAIARKQLLRYELAAKARMHPARLSALLSGRIPLPAELATRIADAIHGSGPR